MKLKGIGTDSLPFVPSVERDSEQPTVFWMKPKTVGLFQKKTKIKEILNLSYFADALANEKQLEFLLLCEKVDNFQFSEDRKDLSSLGILKDITDKNVLTLLVQELSPSIFDEVMSEVDVWSTLNGVQRKLLELLTYFALSKNSDMSVQERLSYNCDTCQVMGRNEERQCFFLNDRNLIKMPTIGEQEDFTAEYSVFPNTEDKDITAEEFLEEFFEICVKLYPTVPAYLSLQRLHSFLSWEKEVCVTGLLDEDYIQVLNWAVSCKDMSALPYPGGFFEQPNQLIEAFEVVNSTISQYEKIKMDSISKKGKSNG